MESETSPVLAGHGAGQRVSAALAAHRDEAALHLLNSVADWPRWRADIAAAAAAAADGSPQFLQPLLIFVDYLSLYFDTADVVWKRLYVGEKLRLLHEPGASPDTDHCRRQQLAADDQRGLLTIFRRKLSAPDFAEFQSGLAEITALLTARPRCWVRALLIGDFLQLDVLALLYAELQEEQIGLEPTCIANANPSALHADLRGMAHRVFDCIFYTPLSDLDCPAIAKLHAWPGTLMAGQSARALADASARQVMQTVDLLGSLWHCPIILNNTACIRRHDQSVSGWLQCKLTRRVGERFRTAVNRRLAECCRVKSNVTIFDEQALLAETEEWELGRVLAASERRHPIVLGRKVAEGYRKLIVAQSASARSPQQILSLENRTVGAGEAIDPVAPTARPIPPVAAFG